LEGGADLGHGNVDEPGVEKETTTYPHLGENGPTTRIRGQGGHARVVASSSNSDVVRQTPAAAVRAVGASKTLIPLQIHLYSLKKERNNFTKLSSFIQENASLV
jgi:hypothetical protein